MEANCLIFPSPKSHTISEIEEKIVLIPRDSMSNEHQLYASVHGEQPFNYYDEFGQLLRYISETKTPRTHETEEKEVVKPNNESTRFPDKGGQTNKIDNKINSNNSSDSIPCLFLSGSKDKLILFFHANGEDISSAYQFLRMINIQSKYPILAMEYRGYSICEGQTSPRNIEADACRVVEFLFANRFTSNQIILFGRSIGCAVALTVTQKYTFYCTILLSPFISLKKVAKQLYCSCAGSMIKEAFDNEENCRNIQCPLLIIHGAKDTLVPFEHSLQLMSGCQSYCRVKIVENMTHTKFNFRMDFIRHMTRFLLDIE